MIRNVSRETQEKLALYETSLVKWQAKINLVSPNTIKTARIRHFEDSLQLEPLIPPTAKALYDIGSGAGFPGLVLAIVRPDLDVTLIESDAKKCAFLQTISRETGVNVSIVQERIEKVCIDLPAPDVITARALASLEMLLDYSHPWIEKRPDMSLILPKGATLSSEIQAATIAGWAFDSMEMPSETDPTGRILVLSNIVKNPA